MLYMVMTFMVMVGIVRMDMRRLSRTWAWFSTAFDAKSKGSTVTHPVAFAFDETLTTISAFIVFIGIVVILGAGGTSLAAVIGRLHIPNTSAK